MKKRGIKLILGALILTMAASFIGCGGSGKTDDTKQAKKETTKKIEGTVTLSGSSALLPLIEGSIDGFNEKYPDCEVQAQAGGSGTGLTQVSEGSVNIGNSDVFAEEKLDESAAKELEDHQVVAQGFGVVVNKDLGVDKLTSKQIQDIFSGKIKNWKDVGGPNKEITVIHRPASSGTRATFVKTVLGGDDTLENDSIGITQDNNGNVLTAMQSNDGAISYLALSYIASDEAKEQLEAVSIDDVDATTENITNKKYCFWSYGHMYTKGKATDAEQALIDYIMSDDNKEVVEELGYIPGSLMK